MWLKLWRRATQLMVQAPQRTRGVSLALR
jgi:hypothetical protein